MRPFFREPLRVLGLGQLQPQAAQVPLPSQTAVLRGLDLGAPGLELRLRRVRQLASLDQAPLEALHLGRGAPVGVAGLPPFLPHDASPEQLEAGRRLRRFARRRRLHLEHLEARLDLRPQILQAEQVGGKLREALRRLLAPRLHTAHLRRLFEQLPALGGRTHDDRFDVVLVDDRVGVDGEAGRREQMKQVAPPHASAVEEVVALPVAFHAPLDRDLVVVDRQATGGVVKHQRDLREGGPRAPFASDVDDLLHLLAAQVACLPGAEDPLDGVDDVGLARTVRADDRRDAAFESNLGRPSEGLEAEQAQRA